MMQLSTQVSDIYAKRCGIERDEVWHLAKLSEELGELSGAYLSATGRGRARGLDFEARTQAVADEVADVFAQILLFANANGIDLAEALARKWGQYLPIPEGLEGKDVWDQAVSQEAQG